ADAAAGESVADAAAEESAADLAAQVELLAAENRRLREEYVRARRTTDRRTALGLFAIGALAVLGGLALPGSREVLFALGGTGLFGGLLTYYLTPEQFVAADTGERVYAALATTGAELVAELGLQDDRVYAPVRGGESADGSDANGEQVSGRARHGEVRLFVPNRSEFAVPDGDDLDSLFVVTGDERERGVSLSPTGGGLYREFESAMVETVESRPAALAAQLADALVEGFELAESASADADPAGGRVTVEISGSVYGAVDRFDHPVASLFAVGLAATLGAPVSATVTPAEDGPADYFVTCEWEPDAVESAEPSTDSAASSER
uniref:hypothetical protein n=1 Tax=Halorussus litoreus TaxID=1710536 RepID=UPI000E25BD3A